MSLGASLPQLGCALFTRIMEPGTRPARREPRSNSGRRCLPRACRRSRASSLAASRGASRGIDVRRELAAAALVRRRALRAEEQLRGRVARASLPAQLGSVARRELRSSSGASSPSPATSLAQLGAAWLVARRAQLGCVNRDPASSRIRLAACLGDDLRHKLPPTRAASRTRRPAPSRMAPNRESCDGARGVVARASEPRRGSGRVARRAPSAARGRVAGCEPRSRSGPRHRSPRAEDECPFGTSSKIRSLRCIWLVTRGMLAWDPSRGAVTPTSRGAASPRGSTERPLGPVEPGRADARPSRRNHAPRTLRLA